MEETLKIVAAEFDRIGVQFLLIGAAARDLIYEDRGFALPRATLDIDIGILIESWGQFEKTRRELISSGHFRETPIPQRLQRDDVRIDIIPFGPIVGSSYRLRWPNEDREMNLLGMMEAYTTSLTKPLTGMNLEVRIPTLPMMAVLKLVAWNDRKNPKDAIDLLSLMSFSEEEFEDRLYGDELDLLEEEAFDLRKASLRLLGRDMASASDPRTRAFILQALDTETSEASYKLIVAMLKMPHDEEDIEKMRGDLLKLRQGFAERQR